ncbi:hypothetical protein HMI54_013164 [Coelomomyces lativittatus]|nr:hypothetical protein HMI56_003486 [Coelomomyces lativittatus]KAJ1514948.1 hypothetical protein HMI54_013164 [Coelomomyces lativittatus]KAJ1517168.1 hypothetical protein HMI55_000473 [Coelomomyces lativittatus]
MNSNVTSTPTPTTSSLAHPSSLPLTPQPTLLPPQNHTDLHDGHEGMHLLMTLLLFTGLILVQVVVLKWKQTSPRTYFYGSFLGLTLVPFCISLAFQFTRFIGLWSFFVLCNGWVVYRASRRPLQSKTPKLVYQFFAIEYQICYVIGIVGYLLLILCIFGIPSIFTDHPEDVFGGSILCMFYGLYFGVLGRDLIHLISEKMACSIGYFALEHEFPKKHLRPNVCAICDDHVPSTSSSSSEGIQLPCTHEFHELCLRGWTILGKREVCPFCKEKVDFRSVLPLHPWDKAQLVYFYLIDAMRYLVVWNPLVFVTIQAIYKILGLY